TARAYEGRDLAAEALEVLKAPESCRGLPQVGQQAAVDDSRRAAGNSSGASSVGSSRWRTLRDLGSQRSVSPRHQSQQPSQEADGPPRSRSDRAQRKAHAPGSGGRTLRQRTPWPRAARSQQPSAEVAIGHAERQAGTLPPEPARKARRLLR